MSLSRTLEREGERERREREREGVYDDNRIACTLAYSWLMSMMRCTIC